MATKTSAKILNFEGISTLRNKFADKKIVHCHGVFDILHAGHLAYFQSAKCQGDVLVVTITADQYVNKGPGRPYFTSSIRANMIAALEIVDFVSISQFPLAVPMIEALKPDIYIKGPDYKDRTKDVTGGILQEEAAVEKHGGKLYFTEDDTFSASTLINRFFNPWTEEQNRVIEAVNAIGGIKAVEKALDALSREKILIVGEPIIDTYIFCLPEGISSKSPTVSAKFLYKEHYMGGSLAIANHLADFVDEVKLLMTHGGEPFFKNLMKERLDHRIKTVEYTIPNAPTPEKIRYISIEKSQRIFESTNLRSDQWINHSPKEFCELFKSTTAKNGMTIIADFGHGLFEGEVLDLVSSIDGFIGLNVQTNSSNFGYNPYTKHKKFSYLSIDTKEVRLAFHDRHTSPVELARRLKKNVQKTGASIGMTLGPNGAQHFASQEGSEYFAPAFADNVLDATGAGDAYFSLTALLVKTGCDDILVPFLGNIYAGLKTKIIGNKASVTKAQLMKAVTAILK